MAGVILRIGYTTSQVIRMPFRQLWLFRYPMMMLNAPESGSGNIDVAANNLHS